MKLKNLLGISLMVSSILASAPMAHADFDELIQGRSVPHLPSRAKTLLSQIRTYFKGGFSFFGLVPQTLHCGDTITSSVALANDLICPDTTGYVLNVTGSGILLDGRGHKIVAPQAAAGVFVQGSNNTVTGLRINGIAGGEGVFGYNAPGLKVLVNDLSANQSGIVLYADNGPMSGVLISGNRVADSSLFGLRTGQDGAGQIQSPSVVLNDFSRSGSHALFVKAQSFGFNGLSFNTLSGSQNALHLSGGTFSIQNLALTSQQILGSPISAEIASSVRLSNVDVSGTSGVSLYQVGSVDIDRLVAKNTPVGVKIATDSGVATSGEITNSRFENQSVAGIMIQSYDATQFGDLRIAGNCAVEPESVAGTWVVGSTIIGSGSSVQASACEATVR